MKPLARRVVVLVVCAALLTAQWPASAWAAAAAPEPVPAVAMEYLRSLGVYTDDLDPLKTYLGNNEKLTPIGRTLYLSLKMRYNAQEEVEAMQPIFERLRGNGTYTEPRQEAAARAQKIFTEKFGELNAAPAGSVEESFRMGALREALMTGAAVADPAKGGAYSQVEVKDGFEFWDENGLAYRMTKNQVTTYNRDLQKNQRLMNLNRPPQAEPIPETGRYNYEMLQHTYWRLKNQETEYRKATRIDRMIAMAELLGKQYPNDMWFNEKGLEEDLIRQAKAKTYSHRGETFSVYEIVEGKKVDGKLVGGRFAQRDAYLEGATEAVQRFKTDMNRFKDTNTITDSQVATLSLDEANALRWLSLAVLETQAFHVKNQRERVDPTAPDAQAVMKMLDKSDMTKAQKEAYKKEGIRMKERLDELRRILATARKALSDADYAGSLDSVQAALASTQKELGDLSLDYSIYLEAPSLAFLAKEQVLKSRRFYNVPGHLYNVISRGARGVYKWSWWGGKYEENMKALEGDEKNPALAKIYADIAASIAAGTREGRIDARNRIMAMNPQALEYSMSGTASEGPSKVNDALRINAALKASHDRIASVTETNKWLDSGATFLTWTASIALMAPVSRATLNGVGKLSNVGMHMINAGSARGGVGGMALQVAGRVPLLVGDIAKHTAARLESLEPAAERIKMDAGRGAAAKLLFDNAAAEYLKASGARALSVATRQATFTALSGGISGVFTGGIHLIDMATNRTGGVNIKGWQAMEPGHTMFSEDWDGLGKAIWTGAKGGVWWANESFHPALGYIGLPSTVFGGIRWVGGIAETIGTRGVIGSTWKGMRVLKNGSAGVEAADAAAAAAGRKGILEKWSEARWYTGKPIFAFGASMADNVMKYVLFSKAAGWVGEKYSWGVETNVPVLAALSNPEEEVERRIKRSKATGMAWFESPLWLLIPTYGAHGMRDAGPYMHTREGMRQYDASGRTAEYANAAEGATLKLNPVKPPLSQRLFEARYFGQRPATEWIVTKQAKEAGQLKEVRRLAEEGGAINPIELMAVRNMVAGGSTFRTVHVTEEIQKATYEIATEGLVAQSQKSLEALSIAPGNAVKGWGEITPEIRIDIAKALYRAETSLGRKLPPELSAKVRHVLKDHLEANLPIGEAGRVLRKAVVNLAVEQPKLDAAQREAIERILDWETAPREGRPTYVELTLELRAIAEAKVKSGELSPKEGEALTALYDYIITGDKRFNSFNKTEIVNARANEIFDALLVKYERSEMTGFIEGFRKEIDKWAEGRKGQPANAEGDKLSVLISRLKGELKTKLEAAPGKLGPSERAALEKALTSVETSAWVVRDAKGGPLSGWRDKQYVRLMQAFLGEGSHAKSVKSKADGFFEAVRLEYKGRDKFLAEADALQAEVNAWVAAQSREATGLSRLIEKLETRLKESSEVALTEREGAALSGLVNAIAELSGQHTGILSSGRKGGDVQLFIKAPTSVGKTMIAYEGLLPYLEAEAAASGRAVMFQTFNTKLQAQAEFDFLAFNKLGSEVKFETYEGFKTMIAEGKSKGLNVEEKYLMIMDEMDAAGQQPALTIGMVSGRVSRLSGQTAALNESNAILAWGMSRLNTIRVEAAEVQAQRIKTTADGLSDAHVEPARMRAIKTAAEDVLERVGQLKRAKGAAEIELAEKAVVKEMASLSKLVDGGGLPAAESEAANTILAGLGRMEKALAERPAENAAVRERIAGEMENAFLSQRRLMNLTDTVEGLSRLPAEARSARMALESKIENLQKALEHAEKSNSPKADGRADLLREQIELARIEKTMIERFDGVDASARLLRLDERIAAIRAGKSPSERLAVNPKMSRLTSESAEVDAQIQALGADAGALKSYRAEIGRVMRLERAIGETERAIKDAKALETRKALEKRLTELNAGRETSKGELRKLEMPLGEAAPRLAELMRRSLTLEARIESANPIGTGAITPRSKLNALLREKEALEAGLTPERKAAHEEYRTMLERVHELSAEMSKADAGSRTALESERATVRGRLRAIELELSAAPAKGDLAGMLRRIELLSTQTGGRARREEAALRREARAEILNRFNEEGDAIVKLTREGLPGWDALVNRLIERRRALQEAYAGDESALYVAYREMKENARPIGTDPRLIEKSYEIPGGEGMEPGAVLKRADFLIERARTVEAKPRGGGAGPLEAELLKSRAELEGLPAEKNFDAVERMGRLEKKLLRIDAEYWADHHLHTINGDTFGFFSSAGLLLQAFRGKLPSAPTESMGLTRYHSAKMLEALFRDPMLPAHQRDNLMWSYLNSLFFPKGLTGRGSYVRSEIINMVQGFHDNAAGVRVDNRTGKFNVVHNGQWFESMDNASRRWWELEYGTDLTLPYTHNSMSTIKDVTTNKKSYYISLSGTSGNKFDQHLRDNRASIVGEGSAMPKNVLLELVSTPEQRLERVVKSLKELRAATLDEVVLRETDAIPVEVKAYLSSHGLKLNDPLVVKISDVPGEAAQAWLRGVRATQKNTGLTVLSVPSTRAMRKLEARLLKEGVKQEEIAKVFSDTEYLRLNVPEANVLRQMNIEGLTTGKVKALILVAPVAGRGLDLNFKGERNSTREGAFRGYSSFEMFVLGPEEISAVHMVQTMGRIDTGRTLSGAPRRFSLLMDIETARVESVFRNMFETDPFFFEMRKDPAFQDYTRKHGGRIDWHTLNDYIRSRAGDEGLLLAQRYEKAVRETLEKRNLEVEESLLISSRVLVEAPKAEPKHPALERIR